MVLKMFKETDWRKMHIFRLQAAVGKGLVSQALGKSQKGHGTEPAGLKGSWNICANWWTSWKLFFFLIYSILIMSLVMKVGYYNSLDTQF